MTTTKNRAKQKNTCRAVELNRSTCRLTAFYDLSKNNSTTFMTPLMTLLILDLIGCVFTALKGHLLGLMQRYSRQLLKLRLIMLKVRHMPDF